jgi:hypothetical protein
MAAATIAVCCGARRSVADLTINRRLVRIIEIINKNNGQSRQQGSCVAEQQSVYLALQNDVGQKSELNFWRCDGQCPGC